jgi:hypothetical protein
MSKEGSAADDVDRDDTADDESSYSDYWIDVVLPPHAQQIVYPMGQQNFGKKCKKYEHVR